MRSSKNSGTESIKSNSDLNWVEPISIGFIGCGTIASAIATGLASQKTCPIPISSISVTKRSESKSKKLLSSFPDLVTVYDNDDAAQSVVDSSDIVFLCVLPEQVDTVLNKVCFDTKRHTLVSLLSTTTVEHLVKKSKLPPEQVFKMICLPAVAFQDGTCLVTPPVSSSGSSGTRSISVNLLPLFQSIGGYIECETEEIMRAMMVPTCLMGPLYGIMKKNRDWLVNHGVPAKDASYFLGKQYLAMIRDAERNCEDPNHIEDLIGEQTPGGLNEQALKNLGKLGGLDAYDGVMDAVLSRLEGATNGNI